MRVVVASEAGANVDAIRRTAKGLGLDCDAADCVSFENLRLRLSQTPSADLVLVAAEAPTTVAEQAVAQASVHAGGPVFVVGADAAAADPLLKSGAQRWLNSAALREELLSAMDQLHNEGVIRPRRGRLLAVTSAHGGVGVTTVAANLAFLLAEQQAGQVLLAELGGDVPHLALDLDLQVPHPLSELLAHWERSDASMIGQAVVPHPNGVHLLVHAPDTLATPAVPAGALRHLSILGRAAYAQVIFDLGAGARHTTADGLLLADVVLVVFRPEVPSVRLTRRFLRHLHELSIPAERILLLANRTGWRQELAQAQIEQTLGRKLAASLPDDPAPILTALNQGVPLTTVKRRAGLLKGLDRVLGVLAAPK